MNELLSPARRIAYIALVSLVFAYYVGYLYYLQIVKGSEFTTRAISISRQIEILPSQRGEIYDRNYDLPLVVNNDSFAVLVVPAEIPAELRSTVFIKLSQLLDISLNDIQRRIPPTVYRVYQAIEVASAVSQETVFRIAERIDEFPGVTWQSKPRRNYLEAGSFSHLIGYVGEITNDELKILYNKGYNAGDTIGKAGVEYQYDEVLRGKDGRQFRTVDVKGKRVSNTELEVVPPVMGNNLVLTIDRDLQILAEKALGQRIGSITVLKPTTGEVLAMVSYPAYDANQLMARGGNNYFASLLNDSRNPLINRAIQSHYPPASTIKMIMTAAILEEKIINPEEKILCAGEIEFGNRVFRCWIRVPGHGRLNLKEALAQSCDVYFWEVGRDRLGIERIVAYYQEFGFGMATGIDLRGEVSGLVPTPQWKERRYNERWLGGDTLNLSIGQGYMLTSPLQVANMLAMIVNEGTIYTPYILKEIRDPVDGSVVYATQPEVLLSSAISRENFRQTQANLRSVLTEGTARYPINTRKVQIAGKTGTAEVGLMDRWHSWFVGYGPYDHETNPDYGIDDVIVVSVMVEAANPWEWWAPYATNIVFHGYFGGLSFEDTIRELRLTDRVSVPTVRLE